ACFTANAVASANRLFSTSPSTINFGNENVGSSSTQTVTLTNTGNGSVTISQANVTGPGFSISRLTIPLTLTTKQSTSFCAFFAPTAGRTATATISAYTTVFRSPCFAANAVASATRLLSTSPTTINFGNVNVGSSSTQTVTLTNTGNGAATISQAKVTGA